MPPGVNILKNNLIHFLDRITPLTNNTNFFKTLLELFPVTKTFAPYSWRVNQPEKYRITKSPQFKSNTHM